MIDPVSRASSGSPDRRPAAPTGRQPDFHTLLSALLRPESVNENDALGMLLGDQLRLTLLEALSRRPENQPLPLPPITQPPSEHTAPLPAAPPEAPSSEAQMIQEEAERSGIDAAFLAALRRVENGGPGREFGVLSVPAPTYRDQARVAAETVQRNLDRFRKLGSEPIDPFTGRYTEAFVRFFSSRYAPIGASNDPRGLNRFHVGNLIRAYLKS